MRQPMNMSAADIVATRNIARDHIDNDTVLALDVYRKCAKRRDVLFSAYGISHPLPPWPEVKRQKWMLLEVMSELSGWAPHVSWLTTPDP